MPSHHAERITFLACLVFDIQTCEYSIYAGSGILRRKTCIQNEHLCRKFFSRPKSLNYNAPQCSHCKRCTSYGNSVRLSVRPSVRPSVTRRYCVKTTARSTVQFALSDSKMCLVLLKPKNIPQVRPLPPEILAPSDLPTLEGSEFWHILPCSASTVRYRKRSPITLNKNSTRAFQQAIHEGSTPPLNPQNGDQSAWICRLLDDFDNKGRNVCCKISLYKNCQRQSSSAINCLSSGINILAGGRPLLPEISAPSDLPPPEGSEF